MSSIGDDFEVAIASGAQHNHHGLETGTFRMAKRPAGLSSVPKSSMAGFQYNATRTKRRPTGCEYMSIASYSPQLHS
jgi:hypothetical protein